MAARRIAITGLGCISAIGCSVPQFWSGLQNGASGISRYDSPGTPGWIAAPVRDFDSARAGNDKQLLWLDRFAQFALAAADEAIGDSGLELSAAVADRIAVVIGSGIGGMGTLDDFFRRMYGERRVSTHPFTIPRVMANAATSHVSMRFGLTGPAFSVATACASAGHAIGLAAMMIRSGMADAAVTGGSEALVTPGSMMAWHALRVMAPDTCRPFSRDRKGMIVGEGAGVVVLEAMDQAMARGATIHAELLGSGFSADAGDIVQPSAEGAARAMRLAMADGGLNLDEVDYINAHGTGTAANDGTETQALHHVFGDHARRLAVSSTKSMHGHAFGAAGALELIATVKAIEEGVVPPTTNYLGPAPDCDLDYVPNEARRQPVRAALSNSFAFGGLNAVLAVGRLR